jgi:four helix bundle protein
MGKRFTDLRVYQLSEQVADAIWAIVVAWDRFAQDTVGKQLCRAADSIGGNIAEGVGKKSFAEQRRYVLIARGSTYETQHWLRRAFQRKLLMEDEITTLRGFLDSLAPQLNGYLRYLTKRSSEPRPRKQRNNGNGAGPSTTNN